MSRTGDHRPLAAATLGSLASDPRAGFATAGRLGLRGVQLSISQAGTRPQELDRSGRRDLLAAARRNELEVAGLDAWIPIEALLDSGTADRAVGEILGAIQLAADLGGVPTCLRLPGRGGEEIVSSLAASAARVGVTLVDHAVPPRGREAAAGSHDRSATGLLIPGVVEPDEDSSRITTDAPMIEGVGIGIDPPSWLVAGLDVLEGAAAGVESVRLSDLTGDGMRIPPGEPDGRIDPAALIAVARTGGFEGLPIIDARRWNDPLGGIRTTLSRIV